MDIKGKIIRIGQQETGTSKSGKPWKKQLYVLETDGEYPHKIAFSLMNEKIEKCNIQIGQTVSAALDIRSTEFNGKWYTSLTAWSVKNFGFEQAVNTVPVYEQQPPQGYAPSVTPQNIYGQPIQTPQYPTTPQSQPDTAGLPF